MLRQNFYNAKNAAQSHRIELSTSGNAFIANLNCVLHTTMYPETVNMKQSYIQIYSVGGKPAELP